jgi:argininosuccinate lyase
MTLLSMGRSLFAGYNRDSQWSKYPVMDVIDECKPSLNVMKEIIISLKFDKKAAYRWCEKAFISATDVVEWLVQKHHLPFREAKVTVEKAVKYSEREGAEKITFKALKQALSEMKIKVKIKEKEVLECQVPERVLKERKAKGGPSPEAVRDEIKQFQKVLQQHKEWLKEKVAQVKKAQAEVKKIAP